MKLSRHPALLSGALLAAALLAAPGTQAQSPSAPLPSSARVIVGFPPGSSPDIVARKLAEGLTGELARAVVVENRVGAGGRIAAEVVKQAPPDGRTLLVTPSGNVSVQPHVYTLPYDVFQDFTPVSLAGTFDMVLAVGSAVPPEVKSLDDFAKWVQANPGKANYGTAAPGTPPHFAGYQISEKLGLGMTYIGYRGLKQAVVDLVSGQLTSMVVPVGDILQYTDMIRPLAATGPARSTYFPDVPTLGELGIPGLDLQEWFGVYVGGKPTPEVMEAVGAAVRKALEDPGYQTLMREAGIVPATSTPAELDALGREGHARWQPLIQASGFRAE